MSDYNISATITADASGYEAAVKKTQKATKSLTKSISSVIQGMGKNGLVGALGAVGIATGGVAIALGVATKAAKAVAKTIGECTDAYKKQLNAERALDTAIKNNPLLNESASKNLKNFASQLQKTSNIGDEEYIPMMTKLAASGRTESEIMKIMQAATDMAATGTISLDNAVTQLNATMNGSIGRLGQQNAELKDLTKEELENGKAVDILADKYKGMAANTIDTSKQLKNAIGDLKEAYGQTFEKALAPMRKFFTEIVQGWADAKKARDEYEGAEAAVNSGTATSSQLITYYEQQLKYIADEKKMYEGMYGADLEYAQAHLKNLELEENKYKSIIATEKYKIKQSESAAKAEAENQATLDAEAEKEKNIADLKDKYLLKLAEQESKWANIKAVTGEEVGIEEKIKFYQDELVNIMTEAGGLITENNQYYKDQVAIIDRLKKGLTDAGEIVDSGYAKKLMDQRISMLEDEKEAALNVEGKTAEEKYLIEVEYNRQLKALERQRLINEMQAAMLSVQEAENAAEEQLKIREYYNNEILKLENKYMPEFPKKQKKEFKEMLKDWSSYAKKVMNIMRTVAGGILSVMKEVTSIFKSSWGFIKDLFNLNIDESLEKLLEFEDRILTFFTSTLPQLPSYVASVLQSISVLLDNLISNVDSSQITNIVSEMVNSLVTELPNIITKLIAIGGNIIDGILNGMEGKLTNIISSGTEIITTLIGALTEAFPQLFKTLGELEEQLMPAIQEVLHSVIEFLITFIKESTPLVIKTLFDFIGIICDELPTIIKGIVEVLPTLIESLIDGFVQFLSDDLPDLINGIIDLLPTIFSVTGDLAAAIIKAIPELVTALIEGIVEMIKGLTADDITKIIVSIIEMVGKIAKAIIESIGLIVTKLLPAMVELVVELIKKIPDILKGIGNGFIEGVGKLGKNIVEGVKDVGSSVGGWFKDLFTGKLFASGTNSAPKGLAIVGEAGPELVNFKGGERVYNNTNTEKMLASRSGASVFNVTFNNTQDTTAFAMMSQLKRYQRNLAFNGVL